MSQISGDGLYPFVQPQPVTIEPVQQGTHARRALILRLFKDLRKRTLQGLQPFAHRDALFDQKRSDLIDRCRATGHQIRPDPMQSLQIQLILALLRRRLQARI